MNLVYEDDDGAYLGITPDFLREFITIESNPHFDVFDSRNGFSRFISVKSSRIPDDEAPVEGRFGIDFNRVKPTPEEAVRYYAGLPDNFEWLSDIAFAAADKNEYDRKSLVWDSFYSYIWGTEPQNVWVAPHSGKVNRPPNEFLSDPLTMLDSWTAGVAAACAYRDTGRVQKRNMLTVHSTGQLGAVVNLGDYGVLEQSVMDSVAEKVIPRYRERVKALAGAFIEDFSRKSVKILAGIQNVRGTLDPDELKTVSADDSFVIRTYTRCLKLYGQEIKDNTMEEFTRAFGNLAMAEVPVILNNFIYPARNTGRILGLSDKIKAGLMNSALSIEGARIYMGGAPELVTDIILDVKRGLFDKE